MESAVCNQDGERHTLADHQGGNHLTSPPDQSPPATEYSGGYDGLAYTYYAWYCPGEAVLIDGFYWGTYEGPSSIEVEDPYGYVVDYLAVDVVGDFFVVETAGHYLPGTYTIWLYDDLDELVSGTAFHITGADGP